MITKLIETIQGLDVGGYVSTADAVSAIASTFPFQPLRDIAEFHEKFGLDYNGPPRALPTDVAEFRIGFKYEELSEYADKPLPQDKLDALVDLVYVTLGTAYLHGYDFSEAWRRVHEANMQKVRARRDGSDSTRGSSHDVVKPPGWTPPDHSDLVEHAR